jgi:branched-chain amino acid transport system substrate-binding protein
MKFLSPYVPNLIVTAVALALPAGAAWADIKIGFNVPLTGFAAADGQSSLKAPSSRSRRPTLPAASTARRSNWWCTTTRPRPRKPCRSPPSSSRRTRSSARCRARTPGSTRAAAGIFQAGKVPYVVAYAIHPDITRTGNYVFRVSAMGEVQGRGGAKLVSNLGKKKVTIITVKNDFGQALAAGFKEAAPKFGLQITGEYEYGMADRQFGAVVSKVKADAPEVIYASGYFFNAGPLVSQLRAAGITAPDHRPGRLRLRQVHRDRRRSLRGTLVTTSLDRDSDVPATKAFLADYRKANNAGADMVAAASFTATSVLIEGLKKSGGKGGDALRAAMAGGTYVTPIGKLTFNSLNEVAKDIQVQVVKDKAFRRHSVISDAALLAPPTK